LLNRTNARIKPWTKAWTKPWTKPWTKAGQSHPDPPRNSRNPLIPQEALPAIRPPCGDLPHALRGHQGLAQAQATVAAGDFGVRVNLEALGLETGQEALEEIYVVEGAAAEANTIQ